MNPTYRLTFILVFICAIRLFSQESLNISLYAQFDRGEERYSGSWFYVGNDGTEYALLGAKTGTAIYQIMEAGSLEEVAFIPGPSTNWREITVVQDHAYVVTDVSGSDHGMQVIRLDQLPLQATLVTTYLETFTKGHIIQKDIFSEDTYVYICGTTATGGVHIMDVFNPESPVEAGLYNPGYYLHDCHIRGDRMYAAAFNEGTIDIVDISDKNTPTLINRIDIPNGLVHSASVTMDGKFLFVTSEQDGLPAHIFNIEDASDPLEIATYSANAASLVHNPYILEDFAFISHNTEGLRVVDISDPETPVEVGFFDTWDGDSGGFHGLWSACPYLPSGKIIGGNREDGLYVWEFNQTKAGRVYGTVVDSLTNLPISNAAILIQENEHLSYSSALGEFRTGAVPGNYTFAISAEGYVDKAVDISFSEESEENIIVKLVSDVANSAAHLSGPGLQMYPNPFSDQLIFDNFRLSAAKILLVNDILGREIARFILNEGMNEITIIGWTEGLYFFKALDGEGSVVESWKLVKRD